MRYAEQKIEGGYKYWTVDNEVFGKMTFEAPERLEAEYLDLLLEHLLKVQLKKGELKVELKDKRKVPVKFIFRKKPAWGRKEKVKINTKKDG